MGRGLGALPRNKKFTGFLSLWGAAKQTQVLHNIPWGMGRVVQARAVQQRVLSRRPHGGFRVSSTCGSKLTWVWPLTGRLSPEWIRATAGIIARHWCCVSSCALAQR